MSLARALTFIPPTGLAMLAAVFLGACAMAPPGDSRRPGARAGTHPAAHGGSPAGAAGSAASIPAPPADQPPTHTSRAARRVKPAGARSGSAGSGPADAARSGPGASSTDVVPPEPGDISTGVVVFFGLSAEQLASIRIIPEEGLTLQPAANGTISGVDGLWVRDERRWFKIPGGTRVTVRPENVDADAGALVPAPLVHQQSISASGLVFDVASSPASLLYQQLKGPGAAAGWQVDSGASGHPTNYPF